MARLSHEHTDRRAPNRSAVRFGPSLTFELGNSPPPPPGLRWELLRRVAIVGTRLRSSDWFRYIESGVSEPPPALPLGLELLLWVTTPRHPPSRVARKSYVAPAYYNTRWPARAGRWQSLLNRYTFTFLLVLHRWGRAMTRRLAPRGQPRFSRTGNPLSLFNRYASISSPPLGESDDVFFLHVASHGFR